MNIFYFERMRVFSSQSSRLVLKLRLPKMVEEGAKGVFNNLYLLISSDYLSECEALSKRGMSGFVSVSFKEIKAGEMKLSTRICKAQSSVVIIKRIHSQELCGVYSKREFIDIYDLDRNIFIK